MRILLTTHQFFPNYIYGTELQTLETALELQQRGHHVEVLTVEPSTPEEVQAQATSDLRYLDVPVHRIHRAIDSLAVFNYHDRAVLEQVRQFLRARPFDAAHVFHCDRLGAGLLGLLKEFDLPVVVSAMDFWFLCPVSQLLRHDGSLCDGPPKDGIACVRCAAAKSQPLAALVQIEGRSEAALRIYAAYCRSPLGRLGSRPRWMRTFMSRAGFLRRQLNCVDRIFVVSELMRELLAHNGVNPALIELCPFGIEPMRTRAYYAFPDRHAGVPQLHARNAKLGRARKGLRFAYLGQLQPHKGVHLAIEAFRGIADRSGSTLTVYGDANPYVPYVGELRLQVNGDAGISFAGKYARHQISAVLSGVDILVVPSLWYENTPFVVLEAFDTGTPVIASNLGGLSQVVRHERNGLLFPMGQVIELRRAMSRLINEEGLWQQLRDGIEPVRTIAEQVDQFLAVYDRLHAEKLRQRFDAPLPRAI